MGYHPSQNAGHNSRGVVKPLASETEASLPCNSHGISFAHIPSHVWLEKDCRVDAIRRLMQGWSLAPVSVLVFRWLPAHLDSSI
jgi:hypothetical protein